MTNSTCSAFVELRTCSVCCHWPPLSQAPLAALQVTVLITTCTALVELRICSACCHWPPFSQAQIAALQELVSKRVAATLALCLLPPFSPALNAALQKMMTNSTCSAFIELRTCSVCCHWPPLSQAPLAALQVTVLISTCTALVELRICSACCHCPPFSQAQIAALQEMVSKRVAATLSPAATSSACTIRRRPGARTEDPCRRPSGGRVQVLLGLPPDAEVLFVVEPAPSPPTGHLVRRGLTALVADGRPIRVSGRGQPPCPCAAPAAPSRASRLAAFCHRPCSRRSCRRARLRRRRTLAFARSRLLRCSAVSAQR